MAITHPSQPVCISGAGIAGMTAALALAYKGIRVLLLERASQLDEVGAGLQLGSNATAQLRQWGVLDALYDYAVEPQGLDLKDGRSGKTLVHMNIADIADKRWQSPYLSIHRADLQKVLAEAVRQNPLIDFKTGCEVSSWNGSADSGFSIQTKVADQDEIIKAPLLAICDGVWSKMRASLGEKAVFSGYIAWRATLDAADVPSQFFETADRLTVTAWMGPKGHFISYPLRKGKVFNFVAITNGESVGETWSKAGDKNRLSQHFAGWHPAVTAVMAKASWTYWPLFKMPSVRFLGAKGEVFLGDASHAVTPFAAQGAAMAIEDAAAFASALAQQGVKLSQTLQLFDAERQKRLKAVAKRGDFNRFVYHASGPLAFARNIVMKTRRPEKFLADLDWLYGYDCTAFLQKNIM